MTVAELIEKLREMPQDMKVVLQLNSNELGNGCEAKRVEIKKVYRWRPESPGDSQWHEDYYPGLHEEEDVLATVVNINV